MKTNYSWNWLLITHLQAADVYLHKCGKVLRSKTTFLQMRSSPVSEANVVNNLVIIILNK